jgi:hypothetical protein
MLTERFACLAAGIALALAVRAAELAALLVTWGK